MDPVGKNDDMKISERMRFVAEERGYQALQCRGDSLFISTFDALMRYDVLDEGVSRRWKYQTPNKRSISSYAFGEPLGALWSEGWSAEQKQYIQFIAGVSELEGTELWRLAVPSGMKVQFLSMPNSIAARVADQVRILDRATGVERVSFPSPGVPVAVVPVDDEPIIVRDGERIWELSSKTGEIRWCCSVGDRIEDVEASANRVLGTAGGMNVFCIERDTGQLSWQVRCPPNKEWGIAPGPLRIDDTDGTIYTGDITGGIHRISPDGKIDWRIPGSGEPIAELVSTPAICQQGSLRCLFFAAPTGVIYLVDPDKGRIEDALEVNVPMEVSAAPRTGRLEAFVSVGNRILLLGAN